jgi:hypothetical protein
MPELLLGINNCFAVKRWPAPADWSAVTVDALGLTTCQLSLDLLPTSLDSAAAAEYMHEARAETTARGLDIHSTFTGLAAYASNLLLSDSTYARDAAEKWYCDMIDLTVIAGARGFGGHIGALSVPASRDPAAAKTLLADMMTRMHRIATYAKNAGLQFLLFENLAVAREYGHTIEEAQALEVTLAGSAVPWILCLDLGHPAALCTDSSSDDPVAWLKTAWTNTPVLQLQQSSRGSDNHGPFTAHTNEFGLVLRDQVLPALAQWNCDTIAMYLEVIPAHEADDDRVLQDIKESVTYWREGITVLDGARQ